MTSTFDEMKARPTAEVYFLEAYLTICSVLVVTLNSLLLVLLFTKVKISRCPACIPVVPMSVLGLLHGLFSTLTITVSFYGTNLLESDILCNGSVVFRSHSITTYIANICIVALEAAYGMSHRFTYEPNNSLVYLIVSSSISLIIPIPTSAAHWIFLTENDDKSRDQAASFYYNSRLKQCFRFWESGSQGYTFYTTYNLLVHVLFIVLVIVSAVVIYIFIERSKTEFHRSTFQDSKARKRAQDVAMGKSAIVLCAVSMLPWLPTVMSTVLFAIIGDRAHYEPHVLFEMAVWMSHSVFWVFPLVCLFKNTAIRRAFHCLKMDMMKVLRRARS